MRRILLTGVLGIWLVHGHCPAGDHFLQWRVEKTRCRIPAYDYQSGRPTAVAEGVSEPAIVSVISRETTENTAGDQTATGETRTFVFDKLPAGPATLTGLAAVATDDGSVRVSGTLNHTGGDTGQLLGNKVIVRAELLTATGESVNSGAVLASEEATLWVRRGKPQTLSLSLNSLSFSKVAPKVERIRLYMETLPCR